MEKTLDRPQLNPHYVFRWEASQDAFILLYPEGLIKLNASAGEILKRCDGSRDMDAVIADLSADFPGNQDEIDRCTRAFITMARNKGWLHG